MLRATSLGAAILTVTTTVAWAADVTPELRQKAESACTADAMALCPEAVGDESQVVACMKAQRAQLTAPCRSVYDQVVRVLKK